jgi:hypothetical protein
MDRNTGRILRQLQEDGLEKDTIVFFYSDHGSGLPRHKRLTLDSGLHVPLIIHFPEKYQHLAPAKPGESTDRLVSFVDFPPTILSLLGIDIPLYMQGKPFLGKNTASPRTHIYGARDRVDEAYDFTRSVRGKRYLYVRNYIPHVSHNQPSFYSDLGEIRVELTRLAKEENLNEHQLSYAGTQRPREALYDTVKDPQNLHNLINSDVPAHRKALNHLRHLHEKWTTDTRDQGFYPEEYIWKNIRRDNTTPYEFAKSQKKFPSARILKAAELVGNPDVNLDQLLGLLGEKDPLLQYWGLIALADGELCETCFDDLRYTVGEEHPSYVRTSAAAILAKHDQADGLTLLRKTLRDKDPDTVLRAARAIELLGTKARPATADIHTARDKWKATNNGSIPMFIWFSLETALHNLGEKVENAGL